ncbi:MAG TPA: HlyD family efflux transporter periplasmic adaptor subunit, partial [Pseudomonadales bacterium]|nr:HlyD family efflux transporter periplasmic adaptor subunit [Pseudomonadales bacterium]
DKGFMPVEINFLQEWLDIWSAEYESRHTATKVNSTRHKFKQRWSSLSHRGRWVAVAVVAFLLFPVRLTVLAPADLIPASPSYIRAPMDGVIEQLAVIPNQRVLAGQELFRFDAVSLLSRFTLAERELATTQAEYRRLAQRALYEAESKAELAVLQSQLAEKQVNVDYLRSLNQRALVSAPIDGIVLLEDPNAWIGRPVATGEKVMIVANDRDVAIEAWLSPGDMITLPEDAHVELFLTNNPLSALSGEVAYISLQPEMRPEGYYAYRVRANLLTDNDSVRIGLKGTLKLHGHRVPMIYWMLRRPMASMRAWLGL